MDLTVLQRRHIYIETYIIVEGFASLTTSLRSVGFALSITYKNRDV